MRKILEAFFRRRTTIILIAVITSGLIIFGTFCRTPQYLSEARFMIPIGRELGTATPNALQAQNMFMTMDYADQIATQMEVLKNRRLVEDALSRMPPELLSADRPASPVMRVARLLLDRALGGNGDGEDGSEGGAGAAKPRELPRRTLREWLLRYGIIPEITGQEDLVAACARRLKVDRQNDTGVMHLQFTHPSPVFARTFLVKYLEAYESLRASSGTAGSDMSFYAGQEPQLRETLRHASDRLAAFRKEWGLLDIQAQRDWFVTERARLDMVINENRAELSQAEAFLKALNTETGRNEPEGILSRVMRNDAGMMHNIRSIAALLARESRLKAEVGKDHPELILAQREMKEIRDGIRQNGIVTLQSQILNAKTMIAEAEKQRNEAEARMATVEAKTVEMRTLEAEVDVASDALLAYGRNRETARVTSQMDDLRINSVMLIEPPTRPFAPESPKPVRDIALGIVFSVFLSLYYAYFMETFSDVVYSMESVGEKFPDAALVSVPEVKKRGDGELPPPESALAMLGRKFFYKDKKLSIPKSILIVGSGNQAGTTSLARMLARYLAKTYNLRVLLVDAHLSMHPLYCAVGGNDGNGGGGEFTLSDWLLDRSKPLRACPQGEVCFLKPGAGGPEARAAMLRTTSDELARIGDFDVVLFDAPTLNADSVTFHLAALTEATLPVVWLEHTRKAVLESMKDELALSGAGVLGVICNRRRFYIPRWVYKRLS